MRSLKLKVKSLKFKVASIPTRSPLITKEGFGLPAEAFAKAGGGTYFNPLYYLPLILGGDLRGSKL